MPRDARAPFKAIGDSTSQAVVIASATATPNRSDGVYDEARRQPITLDDLSVAGVAAAKHSRLFTKFTTRRSKDGAVNAAAAKQRGVRGVDDRIDGRGRDVGTQSVERGSVFNHCEGF